MKIALQKGFHILVAVLIILSAAVNPVLAETEGAFAVTGYTSSLSQITKGSEVSFSFVRTGKNVATQTDLAAEPVEIYYVGNVRSKSFHCSWCPSVQKMSEKNKIIFETRQEALDNGYKGCGNCSP